MTETLEYSRCDHCAIVFLSKRVRASDLQVLYPANYAPYQESSRSVRIHKRLRDLPAIGVLILFHRLLPQHLRRLTREFYQPSRAGAYFVDFGCGSSNFLRYLTDKGWRAVGVDFNPAVVESVRRAGFEGYLVADFWDAVGDATVDGLRMSHVLEHLYDPAVTMERLHSRLRPGGRLHIAVPNPVGISAQLFRQDWFSYDARHVIFFTPEQASGFLEKLGFRQIQVSHEVLSKDMVRSWGCRRHRGGRLDEVEVLALADGVLLNAALLPLSVIAAALRRSDRFHLFATK